jgi:methionyl-tRNA formyltransferase
VRVVFMGTPQFAVASLQALASVCEVVGVYSRPDAVSGRSRAARPSPVAQIAIDSGMPLFQPATLRTDEAVAELTGLAPDLLVVAAYGMILPQTVLDVAPLGAVNVHASLLPRWRGAAPIQRAILAGDAEVGVSIMRMEAGLDTGPYCLQASTPVGDADAVALTDALAALGAEALLAALPAIADGSAAWMAQDEALVTYADKIAKTDVTIGPETDALTALRRIRASSPAAPCRVSIAGRGATIVSATSVAAADAPAASLLAPGAIELTRAGIALGLADGAVLVTRIKPDGKAEMAAADWARGLRDIATSTWNGPS